MTPSFLSLVKFLPGRAGRGKMGVRVEEEGSMVCCSLGFITEGVISPVSVTYAADTCH